MLSCTCDFDKQRSKKCVYWLIGYLLSILPNIFLHCNLLSPGGWMTVPQGLSNCPPGLEYLSMIDGLLVHQKVELLEAFVGFETNNKYTVKNSVGQKVYYAVEDNDCCTRNCCGPMRPFDMKIMDNFRNEVIFHYYTSNVLYLHTYLIEFT